MPTIQHYHHGRFRVAGGMLPDAVTAYCTYGDPANSCIVFPTCYGGRLDSTLHIEFLPLEVLRYELDNGLLGQDYMIGEDKVRCPIAMDRTSMDVH